MNILVTGGAGYIGSHTAQKLINEGFQITVFDNLSTGFREAVPGQADFVHGDILNQNSLSQVIKQKKIDAIVHFAAKLIVPESVEKPQEYYENNTMGVLSLVRACQENGVKKVVFSSTAAVYGDAEESGLISEETATRPLNPYGYSKLFSEQILRDCEGPWGLRSVALRYFNVAGAALDGLNGQRTKNATHLIKVASEAACGKREFIGVYGTDYPTPDGTGVRDYIHVEDLADLHYLALSYLNKGGKTEVFNCGYGNGFSVKEVINTVKKVSNCDFKVVQQGRRAGDAASLVADPGKAKRMFEWSPQRNNLDTICKSAYLWESSR